MSYEIVWHPKVAKFVEKLSKKEAKRVLDKVDDLAKEPFRYLEHFEGEGYKFRIGRYRAIIEVSKSNKKLKVLLFDKRSRIYKR